ncbi:MAG TPA: SRPBCC family protein [Pyrinomonadaceae bacterium]
MTFDSYKFDERLAFASTPPNSWYTDPSILKQEKESVFGRTWQLVGRLDAVSRPGQFFTTMIADEPLLVVRDNRERLRAFSNVCRHRAGPVALGEGERKSFQCRYHGWTYALDGHLMGTPEFDGVECWAKEKNGLPEFRVESWGNLVFVNLDHNCRPLSESFGDVATLLGQRHEWEKLPLAARKDWYVDCNWKAYVDNYLEGYHIPIVHPSLNREIDYASYITETGRFHCVQYSPLKSGESMKIGQGSGARVSEVLYIWFYPNLMLNVYPDNYSTNLIVPLGPERTLTIFEWYFKDPERAETQDALQRTIEFSDEIQREDIFICEAVQRGLRSGNYRSGRYSVKRESGVHHFHGLLAGSFSSGNLQSAPDRL